MKILLPRPEQSTYVPCAHRGRRREYPRSARSPGNQEGFTTATAGSIAEARIQLVRQRPDVMLMDLVLPDGTGIDLLEDLDDRGSTETILITGHASIESAGRRRCAWAPPITLPSRSTCSG
jgi:DNA-binding NarL/FixJ family response regulator